VSEEDEAIMVRDESMYKKRERANEGNRGGKIGEMGKIAAVTAVFYVRGGWLC
jgi:hypothetical protein